MSGPLDLRAVEERLLYWTGSRARAEEIQAVCTALRALRAALLELVEEGVDGAPIAMATLRRAQAVLRQVVDG